MKYLVFLLAASTLVSAAAQITSPGMGRNANADLWLAVGVKQSLDTAGAFQSMTYVGVGRESTRASYNPLQHQGIIVINQECYHRFRKHWTSSLAVSYRRQHEYLEAAPYVHSVPGIKQEYRVYGRLGYAHSWKKLTLNATFRQEYRLFYTPDFHRWKEPSEFRTRLKAQAVVRPGAAGHHRFTLGAEALFTVTQQLQPAQWEPFRYAETRLSAFYTLTPPASKAAFSIGYMADLLGNSANLQTVHYLSFDVVITGLFGGK